MRIQIVIKSDSGTDADLNQVQDTELVSIKLQPHGFIFLQSARFQLEQRLHARTVNVPDDHTRTRSTGRMESSTCATTTAGTGVPPSIRWMRSTASGAA